MKHIRIIVCILAVLAAYPCAAQYKTDTLRYAGSNDDYTDIVFLGEGYTAAQMNKFVQDVKSHDVYFFNKDPWKRYSNMFNVFYVKTPSNVSGAGLTPDKPIDNFYKTTFGCSGVDRMPWPTDMNKVYEVLNATVPQYDMVVILVNSSKYGGAGNASLKMMCVSLDGSSMETICHEAGHAFASLADEYWYDRDVESPNDARKTNPVKWQRWVGTNKVGIYPFEDTNGWYRPHQNCLMRYLNREYCPVCREAIIETIHKTSRIVQSYAPEIPKYRRIKIESDTVFSVKVLAPTPNTLRREWKLDSVRVAYNTDRYLLHASQIPEGTHDITVTVEDTTSLVRIANHSTIHSTTVKWKVVNNVTSGIKVLESDEYRFSVGPVPFTDDLTFWSEQTLSGPVRMELYSIQGVKVAQGVFPVGTPATLYTSNLQPGIYILKVFVQDKEIYSRKLTKEN